jgi:hypothetical protein
MNLLQQSIARIKAKWAWERAQAERRDYVHSALRGGK